MLVTKQFWLPLIALYGQNIYNKYVPQKKIKSYKFGTTWKSVKDD